MRSKLFVPASRPELFAKALASAADALSFDLEDAVDESRKDAARDELARFLRALPPNHGKIIVVRVNSLRTPHGQADLDAIVGPWLDIVNQPKCEGPEDVREFLDALSKAEGSREIKRAIVMPNIESPRALRLAAAIAAASPRVAGLQIGWADLLEGMNLDRYNPTAIQQIQLSVRLAAGEAGIWAYDGAFPKIDDLDAYRREAEAARRLGFLGKSAIHPRQVPIANEVFRPTDAELSHARQVVDAARTAKEQGIGAYTVNGRMIDNPFVKSAERVLELAKRYGIVTLLALTVMLATTRSTFAQGAGRYIQPDPVNFNDHQGWIQMFDGVSLKGWDGPTDLWRVEDGNIVVQSKSNPQTPSTYLIWKGGEPKDFEFKGEVKLDGAGANSGVHFRASLLGEVPGNPLSKWEARGYQADLDNMNTNTGALILCCAGMRREGLSPVRPDRAFRGQIVRTALGEGQKPAILATFDDPDTLKGFWKVGEWNQLHLIARGRTMMFFINGRLMSVFIDDHPTMFVDHGVISIQLEGRGDNKASFRNLWLKNLQ